MHEYCNYNHDNRKLYTRKENDIHRTNIVRRKNVFFLSHMKLGRGVMASVRISFSEQTSETRGEISLILHTHPP